MVASPWVVIALLLGACGAEPLPLADVDPAECVTAFDPGLDYYPTKTELQYARNFSLEYHPHYKVLRTVVGSDGGEDLVVLNRCGTPVPELTGELAGAIVIETPVRALASTSPSSALGLRVLGLEAGLAAIPANPFDSALVELAESGRAARLTAHGDPHLEGMRILGIDALLLLVATLDGAQGLDRAREIGVPAIPITSWAEPDYLGQVEWIKHHAALFEAEAEAEAFFSEVEARYRAVERRASELPRVPAVWASPDLPGTWWIEAGNWQDDVLSAAGGRNVFSDDPAEGYVVSSTEELADVAREAEVWITNVMDRAWLEETLPIETLPAFTADRVYHVHGRADIERNAFDWYETPFVRPDLVLEHLAAILHPEAFPAPSAPFFVPSTPLELDELDAVDPALTPPSPAGRW